MAVRVGRPALPPISPPWALRTVAAARRAVGRLDRLLALPVLRLMEQTILLAEVRATATFAELWVADTLEHGPQHPETIAAHVGADAVQVERLLRFLASRGVVRQHGDRFGLTSVSDLLRCDHPQSVRDWILFQAAGSQWRAWEHLTEGTRDAGMTPFEHAHSSRSSISCGPTRSPARSSTPRCGPLPGYRPS